MKILGIETSCDETAVCLIEASGNFGADFKFRILGNALASQAAQHAEYGGVFPNLAKREHTRNLVPMLELALKDSGQLTANSERKDEASVNRKLSTVNLKLILEREPELFELLNEFLKMHARPDIDALAVTVGPGLEPALWVGVNFARALSAAWNIPVIAVNHMEGHIIVSLMRNEKGSREQVVGSSTSKTKTYSLEPITYPAVALLISGGHTELVLMREWMHYEIIGQTRDDAVGEAFDKVARMLELPYPGGPHISRLAEEARNKKLEAGLKLPRPMLHKNNLDFSFAGLKTAALRFVEANTPLSDNLKKQIAREFEAAAADVLVEKTLRAVEQHSAQTVIVGGGVSANKHIRAELAIRLQATGCKLLISPFEFATDNAVMIALAGYFHTSNDEFADLSTLRANGNLRLGKSSDSVLK